VSYSGCEVFNWRSANVRSPTKHCRARRAVGLGSAEPARQAGMAQGGAYFIGKAELLGWINSTLALNLSKIEQARWAAASRQRSLAVHGAMYIP